MLIACIDGPDKSLNGIATKSDIISFQSQFVIGRPLHVFFPPGGDSRFDSTQ